MTTSLATTVMKRGPAQFNMTGQLLGYPLSTVNERISAGLAQRLLRYAMTRVNESGFGPMLAHCQPEVYTTDADERPAERAYCVRFKTDQGGFLELVGILTSRGWPSLDHGFEVGIE